VATKRAIGRDHGPVTLVGHSCGRTEITEAGVYDKVRSLVYPAPSPTILERATRTWQMVTLASGVTITDRKMAREVTDWFADTENALLFNDSRRVYYFLQTERYHLRFGVAVCKCSGP
jgi:hypothetical protein